MWAVLGREDVVTMWSSVDWKIRDGAVIVGKRSSVTRMIAMNSLMGKMGISGHTIHLSTSASLCPDEHHRASRVSRVGNEDGYQRIEQNPGRDIWSREFRTLPMARPPGIEAPYVERVYALGGFVVKIGYFLSSEEWGPREQLEQARMAEEVGFEALWISDHYHPWTEEQGNSPFVWSVIGGLSEVTSHVKVVTAATCPTMRIHPAVIAQATATSAAMLPGRFEFGVGSGENLNEHVFGDAWPSTDVRLEMLEEAIEVIRLLWEGGTKDHEGKHYRVENARIYTLPDETLPILVSGFGPKATRLAARIGDGYVNAVPDAELLNPLLGRRRQTRPRRLQGLLWRGRSGGPQDRPPALAERLAPRRARRGLAYTGPLRAGRPAGHRGDGRGGRALRPRL